ncbi:MAG: cupin domain-containing protein [Deltaproteobacteria bacterium]|nr:cupin domain-containing protein [Deltaproteobacteria bacterium]MBT6613675.1 cupin domain-containing protein [Deltaproteobacteria bacterium]
MIFLFAISKRIIIMSQTQNEEKDRALEKAIAKRIRAKRIGLNWTLDQLAKAAGLSKGYLSQIENEDKTPTLGTLTKIAFGFGIDAISLITGEESKRKQEKFSLVRAGERQPITHTGAAPDSIYESFSFDKSNRFMDSYIVTISKEFSPKPLMHEGQELAFTLEGTQEFYYDGQTYIVKAGDVIYFDSDRPHMTRSIGSKPARVLVVLCNPLRGE